MRLLFVKEFLCNVHLKLGYFEDSQREVLKIIELYLMANQNM